MRNPGGTEQTARGLSQPGGLLAALTSARAIAVVGASPDPTSSIGGRIVHQIRRFGFTGPIQAVTRRPEAWEEVDGVVAATRLHELEHRPDLIIVSVPAGVVKSTLEEAGALGVPVALVISSGFGEGEAGTSEGGTHRQELLAHARDSGMWVVGPNSAGLIVRANSLFATFSVLLGDEEHQLFQAQQAGPPSRSVLISQSGGMTLMAFRAMLHLGAAPDVALHVGNGVALDVVDVLADLVPQEGLRVGVYLETAARERGGELLSNVGRLTEAGGRVVVFGGARTAQGEAAATSHTGRVSSPHAAVRAALEAVGATVAQDLDEWVRLVAWSGPAVGGVQAAVLTPSGGMGVWLTDALSEAGYELGPPPRRLQHRLTELLPGFASLSNPIDVTGGAALDEDVIADVAEAVAGSGAYDVVVVFTPSARHAASVRTRLAGREVEHDRVPIVLAVPPPVDPHEVDLDPRVALIGTPADAVAFAVSLRRLGRSRPRSTGPTGPPAAAHRARSVLDVVRGCGIALPRRWSAALTPAPRITDDWEPDFRFPCVIKIEAPELAHKERAGLVRLGVRSRDELSSGVEDLRKTAVTHGIASEAARVVVEEQHTLLWELLVGLRRDGAFGWTATVGVGGRLVEDVRRVSTALAPLDTATVTELLHDLFPVRGVDLDALCEPIAQLTQCGTLLDRLQVTEVELNPLALDHHGVAVAIDLVVR